MTKEFDKKNTVDKLFYFFFFYFFVIQTTFFPSPPLSFLSLFCVKNIFFPWLLNLWLKRRKIIFTNWFSFSAPGALSHFVCRFPVSIRMDLQTSDDVKNYLIWITWNQTTKPLLMRETVVSSFLWCAISIRLCKLRQFEIFNQPLLISIC